ncbi:MAG TPA: hypothetical protein PL003_05375 [Bacteroidales bacterium]|nr:hypothetical protein [Bacteroidales bacterium]
MEFFLTSVELETSWEKKEISPYNIYFNNGTIPGNEIVRDTPLKFILAYGNFSFISKIRESDDIENIKRNINKLTNGYLLFFDKYSGVLTIFTDIFGFAHLFYVINESKISISTDYSKLLNVSGKMRDDFAIIDILLFNYALLDRTLIKDIKRIKGGSEIIVTKKGNKIYHPNNYADNFKIDCVRYDLDNNLFASILRESLEGEINYGMKINLSTTGGFDTRALLAVLNNLKLNHDAFTFGQTGNIEQVVARGFINRFADNYRFFELDDQYVGRLPEIAEKFIQCNTGNPAILDLPHYQYIKPALINSNLILGFMGGEIMSGQSIGAEITFTRTAGSMLNSDNVEELRTIVLDEVVGSRLFNSDKISLIIDEYIDTLAVYCRTSGKQNILQFLINEKYAKFFGAVNKLYSNNINIIIPFMNAKVIDYVLHSGISFLRRKPFSKNPLLQIRTKVFYARTIKYLSPDLGDTRFDRLYSLDDLFYLYRFPKVIYGYLQSHLLRRNKKEYPRPHHYDLWFKEFVQENVSKLKTEIINPKSLLCTSYEDLSSYEKMRLVLLSGINLSMNKFLK